MREGKRESQKEKKEGLKGGEMMIVMVNVTVIKVNRLKVIKVEKKNLFWSRRERFLRRKGKERKREISTRA